MFPESLDQLLLVKLTSHSQADFRAELWLARSSESLERREERCDVRDYYGQEEREDALVSS